MDDETIDTGAIDDTSASDDASRGVDTSPADEPAAAPPGRSRLAVAMLAVAALLLIGAVVFGVRGLQAQSAAGDQRDRAAAATKARHVSADRQQSFQDDRDALEKRVLALPDKYNAIGTSYANLGQSYDHYLDLMGQSVDLYNNGDTPGSVALLSGQGTTALDDLTTKQTQILQTVQAAEAALHQIQEGL